MGGGNYGLNGLAIQIRPSRKNWIQILPARKKKAEFGFKKRKDFLVVLISV